MKRIALILAVIAIGLSSGCCSICSKSEKTACNCKGGADCTCDKNCTCKG